MEEDEIRALESSDNTMIDDEEPPVEGQQTASYAERIEYENARKQAEDAKTQACKEEARRDKQKESSERRAWLRENLGKIRHKKLFLGICAVVVLAVAVILWVEHQKANDLTPNPVIRSTTDLEAVMNISELSTIQYDYHGIAEHHAQFLLWDNVNYRVKYKATFTVSYDLTAIRFKKDGRVFTAYLPDPQVGDPVISPNKADLGFLPDNTEADIDDVLDLCEQDAAEFDTSRMLDEGEASLEDTVSALTMPLLKDDEGTYELKFDVLANYVPEEAGDETK